MRPAHLQLLMLLFALTVPGCTSSAPRTGGAPADAVGFEGSLANRFVRADGGGSVVARLSIAAHAPQDGHRPPVNLALVVDTSGSMEGAPIADAAAAAQAMVDGLTNGDRIAVVVFHSKTEVLVPTTELDSGARREIKAKLAAMKAAGTTDMASGLSAGLDEVLKNLDPKGINRVVLLGDGVPNDEGPIRGLAQRAASRGVTITTLGLGPDYNEVVMGAVAQLSGGRFHYVETSSEVARYFQNEVLRLSDVHAKNASLELVAGPGVRIEAVVGQPAENQGSRARITIGDLSRDDVKNLVVKLHVDARRDGAPVELLDGVLRYDDPAGGAPVERRVFLGAHATTSEVQLEAGRDKAVEDAAAMVEAAAATLGALEKARDGRVGDAQKQLEGAAAAAERQSTVNHNERLAERARKLRALSNDLPAPAPAPAAGAGAAPPKTPMPQPAAQVRLRKAHDEAVNEL